MGCYHNSTQNINIYFSFVTVMYNRVGVEQAETAILFDLTLTSLLVSNFSYDSLLLSKQEIYIYLNN